MKNTFFVYGGRTFIAALMVSLLALSCSKETALENSEPTEVHALNLNPNGPPDRFLPNELVVKFKASANSTKRAEALARVSGRVQEVILTKAMQRAGDMEGITIIHTPLDVMEAISRMKGVEIEFAEPNYLYNHDAASTDPYFSNNSLWGMNGTFGCNAAAAWERGSVGSATVVVGVIDEGIQFTHPDLEGQVWTNTNDPVDGVDNDGNGYVDDVHGWDFDGNNNSIYDGGSRGSLDDHGTHVSGTIGANANSIGVVGVNWNVTIISGKFLGRRGGTLANAVKAVDYFTDLKTRHGLNIVATNNSWGGGGFSQALFDAIGRANTANILFVAAAGNGGSDGVGDNNDAVASYPSNYTSANVIAVAAITNMGAKSSFSNYGATTVDLGAPGSGIYSTTAFNGYSSYSGTSMATPHVTGAACLYASTHPGANAAQIKAAILGSVTPTGSLSGITVTGGRLNVAGF